MDEFEEIKATFFQECDELLADLESGLLAMESGGRDPETVNAVFRAVHSVKGGAGAFGLEPLVRYAHVFETLMDEIRAGRIEAETDLVRVLLRAADVLADHVSAARTNGQADDAASAAMVAELEAWTRGEAAATPAEAVAPAADDEDDFGFKPAAVSFDFDTPAPAAAATWRVTFTPSPALYAKANEPGLLLRELARLGTVTAELDDHQIPPLDALDPEGAYLTWHVTLATAADETAIREVFEFVDGDCDLHIEREGAASSSCDVDISALLAAAQAAPGEPALPQAVTAPDDIDISALLAAAKADVAQDPPAASPAPAAPPIARADPAAAKAAPARPAASESQVPQSTIRVDPERIDRLIDLVGELVINQAMLAQRVAAHGFAPSSDISMGLDELEQLTRAIQDGVMAIRAQPVKSVFQRMPRLVREVASQTRKQARLIMEGEGTEVDKTVIERLSDPITHMLRNALDHGLESPEERIAAGKAAEGTVRLAALHRSGRIVIEVQDDGAGINRPRVRQIAIDKGLIAPDATLTDDETDNLIFLPGFSTASQVSDISGRGVGMDVVRRSVQALGGRISIASRPGEGSTFTLSLPLTLAVLDGMVVDVAGQTLVVPLTAIVESLRPKTGEVRALGPQGAVLAVRDTFVRLIDIGCALGFRDTAIRPDEGVVLLIESEDGSRFALVADAIQGQRQVVIKSLEANYRQVDGIAAATILGDGRVALIIDVDALVAVRREPSRSPEPLSFAAE